MARVRIAIAILLGAVAIVLILSPLAVGDLLGREPATSSDVINLRASWGGTLLGIAAFVGALRTLTPRWVVLVSLLMWLMAGIGAARALGFVLDGAPDRLQWIWLGAEAVLVAACAFAILRRRGRQPL